MPKYYLDPETLTYREDKSLKYGKHLAYSLMVLAIPFVGALYLWLYTSVFGLDLPKTAMLKRQKAAWEARIGMLNRKLDVYDGVLEGIEHRDDELYRPIYGLSAIPMEFAFTGFDRSEVFHEMEENGADYALKRSVARVDAMSKRIYLRRRSLGEVADVSRKAGDMLSCVPNIPPLMTTPGSFRISSSFGRRIDPVYGGSTRHSGQDFAARQGTPVYATGDGKVASTSYQYRGYGNQIVIDHGYGYQTRYAHLHTITVAEGMDVKRGDMIGTVGNTGKSTGPHLHYEVIYMGVARNPRNYMDLEMPESDYRAMLVRSDTDNAEAPRTSTMELLRRRRITQ